MALRLMLTRRQREFLREILVIILGVLIALAINEIADLVRWHYRVKETETRIADEMVRDQATLMAITEWQRCARVKLEAAQRPTFGANPMPAANSRPKTLYETRVRWIMI